MADDGEWVTQSEVAALLGVHVSLVGKMVARGDLHPRRARPSLSRREVAELAEQRARPKPPPAPAQQHRSRRGWRAHRTRSTTG